MQVISTDAAPSAPASTVDMSAFARINKAGADSINSLRAKVANLEQKLKHVQGLADIASSKSRLAAEREDFIIEELARVTQDLFCKPPSHFFYLDASSDTGFPTPESCRYRATRQHGEAMGRRKRWRLVRVIAAAI